MPGSRGKREKRLKTLIADAGIGIDVSRLVNAIDRIAPSLGVELLELATSTPEVIKAPACYERLKPVDRQRLDGADLAMLLTDRPYDNNFFWVMKDSFGYFSFAYWDRFTDVPIENGVALFLASKIIDLVGPGVDHDENTGCINDFLWDKKFVDVLMRSAYLCASCRSGLSLRKGSGSDSNLQDALRVLDSVGEASRSGMSVLTYLEANSRPQEFDTFLCHNSVDKPEVRLLAAKLKAEKLTPWLDEQQLRPGTLWQVQLEAQITSVASALVLVGASGMGPWQDIELRAFISEFISRGVPVIPVIMPNAAQVPELPVFLRQLMWVDMRREEPDPISLLKWGITGTR